MIPRNLNHEDLLDSVNNVLECIMTVSDVSRFTSAVIGDDQLVEIMAS